MKQIYILSIIIILFIGCDKITIENEVYFKNHTAYNKQNKTKLTGKLKVDYQNSSATFSLIEYKNGIRNGTATWYYNSGSIKQEVLYVDGKVDGIFKEYYPNGGLKSSIWYKKGKYKGDAIIYDKDGTIIKKISYQ